jgi:hypothetical protein
MMFFILGSFVQGYTADREIVKKHDDFNEFDIISFNHPLKF